MRRRGRGHMLNDCIMTGSDIIAAESSGFAPKISELQFFVTHHAGVRRPAGLVFAGEIINHHAFELISLVNYVMGNAERMRYTTSVSDRLRTAAFVLCSRDTILRPDLHR